MNFNELMAEAGGLPFINDGFCPSKAATLTAMFRREYAHDTDSHLEKYLEPSVAIATYNDRAKFNQSDFPFTSITNDEQKQINKSIVRIIERVPEWADLFTLPIEYRRLTNHLTAVSNPIVPQCIYLGERSFSTKDILDEVLVHEMSHIWYGLMFEICDVQIINSPRDYYLPSGTGPRDIRGLIFALTFAAAAVSYYEKSDLIQIKKHNVRKEHLRGYALGVISTIKRRNFANPFGNLITDNIANFLAV